MIGRAHVACLLSGMLPILTVPRADLGWLAWAVLVPALWLMRTAPTIKAAAHRGWWFGAGYLLAALYWTVPNIGPGLPLIALVFGALWAGWGAAARWLIPDHPWAALAVLPSIWVTIELVRSLPLLGGPWGLLGASQWRHPTILSLASIGGIWLISLALVLVNTALVITWTTRDWKMAAIIPAALLTGPVAFAMTDDPESERDFRVALVQPGIVHNPEIRLDEGERITRALPPVDLIVWGESSIGYDLKRRTDLVARLRTTTPLLVNEDARDATGKISKSAVLIRPDGTQDRYVKTRLVPFGEYIPLRSGFGWLSRISQAAGEDRVPGTGASTMTTDDVTFGPLVCFESTFPDLGRAVTRQGAQVLVYQSSTSTFQNSWAPPQHAALAAVRAAETGRPAVQAALTGVSAAFDARGRRLTWLDTSERGAVTANLSVPDENHRTLYDKYGDYVAYLALMVTAGTVLVTLRRFDARFAERDVDGHPVP
ncbi:apolipoprotein N-acyltransferase [Spirillospora sp. CA-294931]|uniref:apolipoprotein N-acyltransferase n=1 Tax=Spirillospora sp. CA-294931 TaxID=3240042 RepID=UPI003D8F1D46